jgi:purine-binding chemotaxis protein CheW
LQGRVVPVFDLGTRFGEAMRVVRSSDHLVVARTPQRTVALLVGAVVGVVERAASAITSAAEVLPELESIVGVMILDGGLVLVHDLERFLSVDDEAALQHALNPVP